MTIPQPGLFPNDFDSDNNLFLVHDSLRVVLAEDYAPGDNSITVYGDQSVLDKFPPTGLITLTDQCSDVEYRALSFYYGLRTDTTFEDLEILPGFKDVAKYKRITNITQNVMASLHNNVKDAIIAIEKFAGKEDESDKVPLGDTMAGRIGFLENLVLKPRAWFKTDKTTGVAPLTITFQDLSFRNPDSWVWDFGDGDTSTSSLISNFSTTSYVPSNISKAIDIDGSQIQKTYAQPGIYTVKLTVLNSYGEDALQLDDMIVVRDEVPDEAIITIDTLAGVQKFEVDATLPTGGIVKSKINTSISLLVDDDGTHVTDPPKSYIWKLSDDLDHTNASSTVAMYSQGGLYDLKFRVDTQFGSYRITTSEDCIDIIESYNLWYANFTDSTQTYGFKDATIYEFNLLSEVFKVKNRNTISVKRDYRFLKDTGSYAQPTDSISQQIREYLRNNGFAPKNSTSSGDRGLAIMYWASGAEDWGDSQYVDLLSYEGFSDCFSGVDCNASDISTNNFLRGWNWVGLNSNNYIYFLLGNGQVPGVNSAIDEEVINFSLSNYSTSSTSFQINNYLNGSSDIRNNVNDGVDGDFSVYRSTWMNSSGFIMRNDTTGDYFKINSFYKTEGTSGTQIQNIRKLDNIQGSSKEEGQLVSLISGVYFFNNTSEIVAYNPIDATWHVASNNGNTIAFRELQDITQSGFDEPSQTLIATSDKERRAYLSFDYSANTFIKFNESDTTFSSLSSRPAGEQWLMGVY